MSHLSWSRSTVDVRCLFSVPFPFLISPLSCRRMADPPRLFSIPLHACVLPSSGHLLRLKLAHNRTNGSKLSSGREFSVQVFPSFDAHVEIMGITAPQRGDFPGAFFDLRFAHTHPTPAWPPASSRMIIGVLHAFRWFDSSLNLFCKV